jgi:thiosulfate dehydrogenase
MKEAFEPFIKLIVLIVGLLTAVTVLSAFLIGVVVFVLRGGSLPDLGSDKTEVVLAEPAAQVYLGLITKEDLWKAPDWTTVENESNAEDIKYGRELIAKTSEFLGPNGKVKKMSNGMNCQNCHLDAGTAPLGNNYSAVFATYPKIRGRSGQMEDIPKRINDCFERSLNGGLLESNSKEMKAMVAYIEWLGRDVPKGETPKGAGLYEVPFLDRASDPIKGKVVYAQLCQSCHMEDGQGLMRADKLGYTYPPLWGENSYNHGAGLFRMSRFAGYVKANMPLGATYERPILTDEEAWDVAAYVNSLPRPQKDLSKDWPDISKKPIDHPFGPFSDDFTEEQHKFGPFIPIQSARASQ